MQLLGVCMDGDNHNVSIITEYMPNGALKDYLRKTGPTKITFDVLIDMLYQVSLLVHFGLDQLT